jgi:hypothetical protein
MEAEGAEEKKNKNKAITRKRKQITLVERYVEISKREKKVLRYPVCTEQFVELTDEDWVQCGACEERRCECFNL